MSNSDDSSPSFIIRNPMTSDVDRAQSHQENLNASAESATVTRVPKCARCRNHGVDYELKGHKEKCKYRDCTCRSCLVVVERQKITAARVAHLRHQRKIAGRKGDTLAPYNALTDEEEFVLSTHMSESSEKKDSCKLCENANGRSEVRVHTSHEECLEGKVNELNSRLYMEGVENRYHPVRFEEDEKTITRQNSPVGFHCENRMHQQAHSRYYGNSSLHDVRSDRRKKWLDNLATSCWDSPFRGMDSYHSNCLIPFRQSSSGHTAQILKEAKHAYNNFYDIRQHPYNRWHKHQREKMYTRCDDYDRYRCSISSLTNIRKKTESKSSTISSPNAVSRSPISDSGCTDRCCRSPPSFICPVAYKKSNCDRRSVEYRHSSNRSSESKINFCENNGSRYRHVKLPAYAGLLQECNTHQIFEKRDEKQFNMYSHSIKDIKELSLKDDAKEYFRPVNQDINRGENQVAKPNLNISDMLINKLLDSKRYNVSNDHDAKQYQVLMVMFPEVDEVILKEVLEDCNDDIQEAVGRLLSKW